MPGTINIILPVGAERGPAQAPSGQAFVLNQAPVNWSAPGTISGGADGGPPLLLAAPAVQTLTLAPSAGVSQVIRGGLTPAQPPPVPALVAQITPISAPATTGTQPQMAFADGHLDASQAKASLDDSCVPGSVYKNFRRWQRFKTLARSHLPQSPDGEALSCFFM